MKVRFVTPPPNVLPRIEVHLGETAEVVHIRKWQGDNYPSLWLIRFKDSTQFWIKPQYLEILNEPPEKA